MARGDLPKYVRLAREIAASIASGRYRPGDRLPSEDTIGQEYGYSRGTAAKAYAMLERKELVVTEHPKGRFVKQPGVRTPLRPKPGARLLVRMAVDEELEDLGLDNPAPVFELTGDDGTTLHRCDEHVVVFDLPAPDTPASAGLVETDRLPASHPRPGWRVRFSHAGHMSLGLCEIEAGAAMSPQRHPQEEVWCVQEGELELVVGGKAQRAGARDVFVVPSNVEYSVSAVTSCRAIVVGWPGLTFPTP